MPCMDTSDTFFRGGNWGYFKPRTMYILLQALLCGRRKVGEAESAVRLKSVSLTTFAVPYTPRVYLVSLNCPS
jgi:hypothetical protein